MSSLSEDDRSRIIERYMSGEKIDAIAADFGIDRSYPGRLTRRRIPTEAREDGYGNRTVWCGGDRRVAEAVQ